MPGTAGGSGTKLSRLKTPLTGEARVEVVRTRRKARLRELGLLPPEDSPFINGHIAVNPGMLKMAALWGM